jgi:hypothetical protein
VKKCSLDELIEVKDDRYIAMLADKQNMGGWTPGGLAERLGKGEMGRVLFRDSMVQSMASLFVRRGCGGEGKGGEGVKVKV